MADLRRDRQNDQKELNLRQKYCWEVYGIPTRKSEAEDVEMTAETRNVETRNSEKSDD